MSILENSSVVVGVLLGGFCLGGWCAWILFGKRRSQRARARSLEGNQAEEYAAAMLQEQGFEILEHPFALKWTYWIDGEAHTASLRADFRVERDGLDYLVEVKSTPRAGVATLPETRRQLLEYSRAFGGPVMLLCTETQSLVEVSFAEERDEEEAPGNGVKHSCWWWFGIGGWIVSLVLLSLHWTEW